jgi:Protein of unknown function (DUF3237)
VQFSYDGLTLWYGTADTPAPQDSQVHRAGTCLTVGVCPVHLSNRVVVQFCVDGGTVQTLSARLVQTHYERGTQYFRAVFPDFWSGKRVEYRVIFSCAGRQVPDIETARQFMNSFELEARSRAPCPHSSATVAVSEALQSPQMHKFSVNLDYLARVTIQLRQPPEIIGETPEGLKVNWSVSSGTVAGPKLNATVRSRGGDWMTVRTDGVGLLGIHATLETYNGALIYTQYSGVFELGEDGYQNFLNKKWPNAPSIRTTPRFLTEHPQYRWLNRLQCIGVGEVRMSELLVVYDLYAF